MKGVGYVYSSNIDGYQKIVVSVMDNNNNEGRESFYMNIDTAPSVNPSTISYVNFNNSENITLKPLDFTKNFPINLGIVKPRSECFIEGSTFTCKNIITGAIIANITDINMDQSSLTFEQQQEMQSLPYYYYHSANDMCFTENIYLCPESLNDPANTESKTCSLDGRLKIDSLMELDEAYCDPLDTLPNGKYEDIIIAYNDKLRSSPENNDEINVLVRNTDREDLEFNLTYSDINGAVISPYLTEDDYVTSAFCKDTDANYLETQTEKLRNDKQIILNCLPEVHVKSKLKTNNNEKDVYFVHMLKDISYGEHASYDDPMHFSLSDAKTLDLTDHELKLQKNPDSVSTIIEPLSPEKIGRRANKEYDELTSEEKEYYSKLIIADEIVEHCERNYLLDIQPELPINNRYVDINGSKLKKDECVVKSFASAGIIPPVALLTKNENYEDMGHKEYNSSEIMWQSIISTNLAYELRQKIYDPSSSSRTIEEIQEELDAERVENQTKGRASLTSSPGIVITDTVPRVNDPEFGSTETEVAGSIGNNEGVITFPNASTRRQNALNQSQVSLCQMKIIQTFAKRTIRTIENITERNAHARQELPEECRPNFDDFIINYNRHSNTDDS